MKEIGRRPSPSHYMEKCVPAFPSCAHGMALPGVPSPPGVALRDSTGLSPLTQGEAAAGRTSPSSRDSSFLPEPEAEERRIPSTPLIHIPACTYARTHTDTRTRAQTHAHTHASTHALRTAGPGEEAGGRQHSAAQQSLQAGGRWDCTPVMFQVCICVIHTNSK